MAGLAEQERISIIAATQLARLRDRFPRWRIAWARQLQIWRGQLTGLLAAPVAAPGCQEGRR